MRCYSYLVQATSEEEKRTYGTTKELVDYLNERIGMKDVYTGDLIQNYFKPRKGRKNVNPLIRCLYQLSRDRTDSRSKAVIAI